MNSHDTFARNTRRATLTFYLNNTYHLPNSHTYLLAFSNIPSLEHPPAPLPSESLLKSSAITANLLFLSGFEFQNSIGWIIYNTPIAITVSVRVNTYAIVTLPSPCWPVNVWELAMILATLILFTNVQRVALKLPQLAPKIPLTGHGAMCIFFACCVTATRLYIIRAYL
jgi:hypothetical protein